MHHANIAMLRALGKSISDCAGDRLAAQGAPLDIPSQVARFVAADLATACLRAADDLAAQDAALRAPFDP